MTISSETDRDDYDGNGATTQFTYSFRIFDQDDLLVTLRNDSTGVETTWVRGVDYTVANVGEATGTITATTAPATGESLTIRRVLNILQETDLRNQGDFFPQTHEDVFDRIIMICLQQQDEIDGSFRLSETYRDGSVSTIMPAPEADKFVGWNSAATGLINKSAGDIVGAVSAEGNITVDHFIDGTDFTAGSTTQLTLSGMPATEKNTQVYFDGVYQDKETYSLADDVITFASAIPGGTGVVEVVWFSVNDIGTPSDGTVTTVKLADGSVTTAKLAASAVTAAKLAANAVVPASMGDDDVDGTWPLGRVKIGSFVAGDEAAFAHYDQATTTGYALRQNSSGDTYVNAANNRTLSLRVNDSELVSVGTDQTNVKNAPVFSSVITPTQITADQNNYNPSGLSSAFIIQVDSDDTRSITGITAGTAGQVIGIYNDGTEEITLTDQDANSSAANRFAFLESSDQVVPPGGIVWLIYLASRWRYFSGAETTTHMKSIVLHEEFGNKDSMDYTLEFSGAGNLKWKVLDDIVSPPSATSSDIMQFVGSQVEILDGGLDYDSGLRSVDQGAAKAWVDLDGTGTATVDNSYNIDSVVDNGTGDYTFTIGDDFANADFAIAGVVAASYSAITVSTRAVGSCRIEVRDYNAPGFIDSDPVLVAFYGDK